jgi:hypothetical protein
MSPRTRTVLLIVFAVLAALVLLILLSGEDDDGAAWRALSGVTRLLAAIGRAL